MENMLADIGGVDKKRPRMDKGFPQGVMKLAWNCTVEITAQQ